AAEVRRVPADGAGAARQRRGAAQAPPGGDALLPADGEVQQDASGRTPASHPEGSGGDLRTPGAQQRGRDPADAVVLLLDEARKGDEGGRR
ncbi:unnamed protein product, partial [Ectocarpus sp. 12 AP-2014]